MVETVIALLMIMNNEIKEHRIKATMSECLKSKRIAERGNRSIQYSCVRTKAELEKNIDGSQSIKKLIMQ